MPGIADPAPLGLAAFALTTFLLSAFNAHWMTTASGLAWLGYALAYGGLVQLLAGMWEFRNRNVFGATAFASYGGFWIGLFFYFSLVGNNAGRSPGHGPPVREGRRLDPAGLRHLQHLHAALGTQVNVAVFGVFLTLEITEIILFIGFFTGSSGTVKFGGYVGVLTALVAWYASAAGRRQRDRAAGSGCPSAGR